MEPIAFETAWAFVRGHEVYYSGADEKWRYADTDALVDGEERPCKRCGRMPTAEGYDACLGHVEGAVSACCGHGVEEPYSVME